MKPSDYQGYTPGTTEDAAMVAFLMKHPEEIGAELEVLRTASCILVRRKRGHRERDELDRYGAGDSAGDSVHTEGVLA